MEVFVPFNEKLVEEFGCDIGRLVPFQIEYKCYRVNEELGTLIMVESIGNDVAEPALEVLLKETA